MSVGEICHRDVVVAHLEMGVEEAARLMRAEHVGSLIVVEVTDRGNRPVGVITDRDLVVEVLATEVDATTLAVEDLVGPELLIARESDGIWETILRMRAMGVRRLPVVDGEGMLCGILSMDDLLVFLAGELSDLSKLIKQENRREKKLRDQ
jgi:predicted transcriptional regulator